MSCKCDFQTYIYKKKKIVCRTVLKLAIQSLECSKLPEARFVMSYPSNMTEISLYALLYVWEKKTKQLFKSRSNLKASKL